jgi:4-hydroxybenzoate polyprenyltransferase
MDNYFRFEIDSWGISASGAQGYFGASWLLLGIAILSVVGYRIVKRIRKGK